MKSIKKIVASLLVAVCMFTFYNFPVANAGGGLFGSNSLVEENQTTDNSDFGGADNIAGSANTLVDKTVNVFRSATRSTNSDIGNSLANAFDGNKTYVPSYTTRNKEATPAIITLTLPAPILVGNIIIYERAWDNTSHVSNFTVKAYNDANAATTIVNTASNPTRQPSGDVGYQKHDFATAQIVPSKKYEIILTIRNAGTDGAVHIFEIEGYEGDPAPLTDPLSPEGTTDFAVGSKAVASSELNSSWGANEAILPYTEYNTGRRWSAPIDDGEDVTCELTFSKTAAISFVKVAQYQGPAPSGWDSGRIAKIKIELAGEGEPYTVIAYGAPTLFNNSGMGHILSGIYKTLEIPMRASRMRVSMTPNAAGKSYGINIKAMMAYGIEDTTASDKDAELKNTLNVAYAKNKADYTPASYAKMNSKLAVARAIFGASAPTATQIKAAVNGLTDSIYTLEKNVTTVQKIKVAFVGDSITVGAFLGDGEPNYPATVQRLLGTIYYEFRNFAISGRTLSDGTDLPYMNEPNYQSSLNYKPDVVVIMLGTNDSKPKYNITEEKYLADARKLINSYKLLDSQPAIFFNTSPKAMGPLGETPNDTITPVGVTRIVGYQRKVLEAVPNLYSMDIFTQTAGFVNSDFRTDAGGALIDGVHPSKQGHDKLADIVVGEFNKNKPMVVGANRQYLASIQNLTGASFEADAWNAFDSARAALVNQLNSKTSTVADILSARTLMDEKYAYLADHVDNSRVRIACVGDSITKGDGAGNNRYPQYLQIKLDQVEPNKFTVLNCGENGMMASDRQGCGLTDSTKTTGEYPYYNQLIASVGLMPNIVTIKLGTNDAKYEGENMGRYTDDMKKIISIYQNLPTNPQIILVTSARAVPTPGQLTDGWANAINDTFVPLQRALATELGLPLIDINAYTKYAYEHGSNPPRDGIHGNYPVIAEGMWNALNGSGTLGNGTSYVANNPSVAFKKKYLNSVVEQGKKLVEADYEATSWAVFQAKFTTAKELLASATATVAQIDNARVELKNAITALSGAPVAPEYDQTINLALSENGTVASAGVNTGYQGSSAGKLNDGDLNSYWLGWHGSPTVPPAWATVGDKNWIEFTFNTAKDVKAMHLYSTNWNYDQSGRDDGVASYVVQYWSGSAYVNVANYTQAVGSVTAGGALNKGIIPYTMKFDSVNTTKIRIVINPKSGQGQSDGVWIQEVKLFAPSK